MMAVALALSSVLAVVLCCAGVLRLRACCIGRAPFRFHFAAIAQIASGAMVLWLNFDWWLLHRGG